jgi:glyoxalase family protein
MKGVPAMLIRGLHHITLICSDAQRTVDFYTQTLGLRLIKKTVNFDDPSSYHLYFGDELGRPGTVITFFEWPAGARGYPGIGGTDHLALQVADDAGLLKWKRRLTDMGVSVEGPLDLRYFKAITFNDPDGTILEIATMGPGWTVDEPESALGEGVQAPPERLLATHRDRPKIQAETWPEPVPEITPEMTLRRGMHHVTTISSDIERTHAFLAELLGLCRVKMTADYGDPAVAHWTWGLDGGRPGTLITAIERRGAQDRRARIGVGQTHHFALAVPDRISQMEWRERLLHAGLRVTPIIDRVYFTSIYTRDPDGHIVELATAGPGFGVDEAVSQLGQSLQLPPWLESRRSHIESTLRPIRVRVRAPEVG